MPWLYTSFSSSHPVDAGHTVPSRVYKLRHAPVRISGPQVLGPKPRATFCASNSGGNGAST